MKDLKVIHEPISRIQEWDTKYMNSLADLARKIRQEAKLDKVEIRMLMQSNKKLGTYVANIISSYARLYNGLDSLVIAHKIPSIGPFAEIKGRNIIR